MSNSLIMQGSELGLNALSNAYGNESGLTASAQARMDALNKNPTQVKVDDAVYLTVGNQQRRDAIDAALISMGVGRLDSEPLVTSVARGLELVDKQVSMEMPAPGSFGDGEIFPIQTANDPFATSYVHYNVEAVGQWKQGSPQTTDIPQTEAAFAEWIDPIYSYYGGYTLSPKELAVIARAGMNGATTIDLPAIKRQAMLAGAQQMKSDLVLRGDPSVGLPGFANHPERLTFYSAVPITTATTPESDLAVFNLGARYHQIIEPYRVALNKPDTVLISNSIYNVLADKLYYSTPTGVAAVTANVSKSTLQYCMERNGLTNVKAMTELDAAQLAEKGLGANNVIVFYKRNPANLRFQMTTPDIMDLPPKEFGWDSIVRASCFSTAGVLLYRKAAMVILVLP